MDQNQVLDKILIGLQKVEGQIDSVAVEVLNIKEELGNKPNREEVDEKFGTVLNNVDRFVKLHETLDQELAALRNKYSRLEERLNLVERKLQIA